MGDDGAAMLDLITGHWMAQALAVAARLGVADLLADGPRPADELARANQMDAAALYRVLRALASVGVFAEVDGRFANTPRSDWLRSDVPGSLRALAIAQGEPASWRLWGELYAAVKAGGSVIDRLDESAVAAFGAAAAAWSLATARAIATAYDFGGMGRVVDVGGGGLDLLRAILGANPHLGGVLFDAPAAFGPDVEAAGLTGRLEVVGGGLDALPVGADVYLLRQVLHDGDDDRARLILRGVRRAVGPGGRLLVGEVVVGPGNEPSPGKRLDLGMLVMSPGGRERTADEYAALYEAAGFRLTRIVPTATPLDLVEGEPA